MVTKKKKKKEVSKALDIAAALSAVTKEKSISIDLVLDSLKDAIASAAKKYLNSEITVEVAVDREKGTIEAFTLQNVVEVVEDPDAQIGIEEAKKIDKDLEIGDEVVGELDINEFGRSAIQTAKQIIMQRVREFERQKIFTDYSERIGELVTGTVQQIDKGNILINLGRTEALLPFKEQIRRERYRQGDTIRGCVLEVKNNLKGPQVIISRTSPSFLERLFEIEVPEIFENIVRIIKVVRAPGYRAKIGVTSSDPRVDPVGACVGMRGNRVQAIVRELSNERMDIINWTDETNLLVRRIFSPSEVKRVIPVGQNRILVIVLEEDLAQAIGKEGQNIKLASKLIDKDIDIYGDEEFEELTEEERDELLHEETLTQDTEELDDSGEENGDTPNDEKEVLDIDVAGEDEGGATDDADDGDVEENNRGEIVVESSQEVVLDEEVDKTQKNNDAPLFISKDAEYDDKNDTSFEKNSD